MAERMVITGRVQGVSFRAFAKEAADALGIYGWVRNRADGSVEVLAEGAVEAFAARLSDGPPAARVENVSRESVAERPQPRFEIRG